MSEEVLRSYRLTSMEEPTDEMLHAIMEKVAESARDSTRRAEAKKGEMLRIAIENANRKAECSRNTPTNFQNGRKRW